MTILQLYFYIYIALTVLELALFSFGYALVATWGHFKRHEPGELLVGFVVGTVVFVLPANIGLAGVITAVIYIITQAAKITIL